MKKRSIALALALMMFFSITGGVIATTGLVTKNIEYSNIQIVVNGSKIVPRDANGVEVEPFTMDGTTYLPVRAVSEALGYNVSWNQENHEVLVGNFIPKYIFYFIGDGMGLAHRQLAEYYQQYKKDDENYKLAMNDMPITTNVTTHSYSSLITDSAAAGTALSTGKKSYSGAIGVGPDGEHLISITDALKTKGMGIGLITTVSITHATPAAFGAHMADRNDESAVAVQYLDAGWDFLAGGGRRYFTDTTEGGKREEGDSLIDTYVSASYTVDKSISEYNDTDFSLVDKYLGIYEDKYLTDVITQTYSEKTSPELYEMVEAGIEVLSKNENGFFMMVEGGYIDGASHNNDRV